MADHRTNSPYAHPQRLFSDHVDTSKPQTKPNPAPSNFFSSFLSKSVLVGILLVLLLLFPSQAPEFVNQTILTRSWELVHPLFVGIAFWELVVHLLFSRRHGENEKENHSKFDTTQSYMSRIHQLLSGSDESKIQTWNSHYYRGNSTVLVAETDLSLLDEHNRTISSSVFSNTKSSHKPFQLPLSSLRSQFPNIDETASASKSGGSLSGSLSRSGTLSRSGSGVKNPSNSLTKHTTTDGSIVKWIKHYSSSHKMLLVGEGDFSFSTCLAKTFGSAHNMVATSLDSEPIVIVHYSNATRNIHELKSRGCKVMHSIDATKMARNSCPSQRKFDRIVFNFPYQHAASKHSYRVVQLVLHQNLVWSFFKNAKELLAVNGEIHVTHKTNSFHCEWDLQRLATLAGLRLIEQVDFNLSDYPGYSNKFGLMKGVEMDSTFNCQPSSTYKFGHAFFM